MRRKRDTKRRLTKKTVTQIKGGRERQRRRGNRELKKDEQPRDVGANRFGPYIEILGVGNVSL